MVLGAVPLAMATGAGAESRIQIGLVIVGGMTFGTVLTLFVVPVIYTLMARPRKPEPQADDAGHATSTGPSAAPEVQPAAAIQTFSQS